MKSLKNPSLTIVVLAYNEEDYLGACLTSIAGQTVPPDEVIVVNNNSTDKSADIARSFPFVTLVNEKQQGMAYARNLGFDEAKSTLIARIDADCKLPSDWVENVHAVCDEHAGNIFGASGPVYLHDTNSEFAGKLIGEALMQQGYFKISKLMLGHNTFLGANMIITKKAWAKVRDEVCVDSNNFHEDVDLSIHLYKYGDIIFDRRIRAGVSKRGFKESPAKTFWRFRIWPNAVTRHRKLFITPPKHL